MFFRLDLPPILAQQCKQRRKIRGFLQERSVNGAAKLLTLGRLRLIPQPLIVRPSTSLRVFHNGQTLLHTQGIAEALDALVEPQKLRNFLLQSRLIAWIMM